ncbi:MAG: TonB family protein [Acidobacteriia bacterium]|nr:TonB family protein [Terriglobia bacterium]
MTQADRWLRWVRSAVVFLLFPPACLGQSISGVVYDPDGYVVQNARVLLMRDYSKLKETKSGEAGEFAFPGLEPGMYQLQVKQERLSLFQQTVVVGKEEKRVYAVLPLARETESVQINARLASGVRKSERISGKAGHWGGQVEPAILLQPLRPAYPPSAIAQGTQGTVVLYATIKTDGSVSDPIVLESADPDLEKEALQATRKLLYQPMKLNGHPVPCQVTIILDFKPE